MHELSMDLTAVLRHAVAAGASDVHFKVGQPPVLRSDGKLAHSTEFPALGDADLQAVLDRVTVAVPRRRELFDETGDLDLAYSEPGLPRFRVNGFRQRGAISFAFRVIPDQIPSFGELHLPPGVARLAEEQRGLVLVTGATGSGKTTTLAAMLDHINRTRRQHIVTIEDPIGGDIGNHVNFQGALYIVNDFDMDNNTTVWGPVITRSSMINNSAFIHAPPFPIEYMVGMPAATQTVTSVNPVQGSYSG